MACAMCVDIKKKRETAVIITELILDPHTLSLSLRCNGKTERVEDKKSR